MVPGMISVIIPNLNGEATLGEQLEALAGQTFRGRWEVVISDNGSTDDSAAVIDQWKDRLDLMVVDSSDRRGLSHASNTGAAAASGEFLVFCDNDDVVAPQWLEAMAAGLADYDLVGGWIEQEKLNGPRAEWRTIAPRDRLPVALRYLPFVPSGNCGVRTEVFRSVGGWNEEYHTGLDEDLSFRTALAGYRLGFAPDAVIHYRHRTGTRAFARQQYTYAREEAHLFRDYAKHGLPASSTRTAVRELGWLVLHLPDLFGDEVSKHRWIGKAAFRWGRLCGSIKYRVVFL